MSDLIKQVVLIYAMDKNRKITHATEHIVLTETPFADRVSYIPIAGDKIWFYPGCDIPRFKVKQFCMNNKVSVVKTKERSTVRFVGQQTLNEMSFGYNVYRVEKSEFLTWLDSVMCNAYMQLSDDIIKTPSEYVYIYGAALNSFCDEDEFGEKIFKEDYSDMEDVTIRRIPKEENYQQLVDMLQDSQLYYQDGLLNLLNTGMVIDEETYQQMHRLFESSDSDNTRVAMESMANCDFQRSAVYLLMLMRKFGSKINNSGVTHHVNFKSLIKYFQIKNLSSISVDDMIDSLIHQKLLNLDNLNYLLPLALQTLRESGEMRNIKIKDLELSGNAEKAITENILDKQAITISAPILAPEQVSNQESLT